MRPYHYILYDMVMDTQLVVILRDGFKGLRTDKFEMIWPETEPDYFLKMIGTKKGGSVDHHKFD